jgi:DNA-binding NtrC family response regulator
MPDTPLAGLSVLIIEDEPLLRRQLVAHLEHLGADVTGAGTLAAGARFLGELSFDFALLDVNLPDGQGTSLLRDKVFSANTGVIVMTADGAVAGAVEAMRLGALDYLVKPFEPAEVPLVIARAVRTRQTVRVEEHRRNDDRFSGAGLFFGQAMATVEKQMEQILAADNRMQTHLPPVLIQGETGTGKTTVARWLHHHGPRAAQPLVEMNCSAVPDSLAESELFGHERGAFTDARTGRIGLFEAAHGGTLFLDELPSLSLALQAKVLKTIEDHRLRRLGGNREIPIDVRVVAASHRNLKDLIVTGQFREDLYHRLDLYRILLPPLRERGQDILTLAEQIMERLCRRHRLARRSITAAGRQTLLGYAWPGNVRELSHELERAIVFTEGDQLSFDSLRSASPSTSASASTPTSGGSEAHPDDWLNPQFHLPTEGFQLEEAINRLIQLALQETNQNVSAAARRLGVSRDYLRYRLSGGKSAPENPGDPDR